MELPTTIFFSYLFAVILLLLLLFSHTVRQKINWVLVGISLIIPVLLSSAIYFLYGSVVSADTEYFGGYVIKAEYYEDWDERVSCRHPIYCKGSCSTDSKGTTTCAPDYVCGHSHSYDVDYHPPEWQVIDSNKNQFDIGQDTFEKLAKRWSNRKFVELNRNFHSKDGNAYVSFFDEKNEHIETTAVPHTYKNNIPASDSLLRFRDISPEEAISEGLYSYPNISNYYQPNIIAPAGLGLQKDEYYIQLLNARLGRKKQVRCFLLVYLNKSAKVFELQKRYWQQGNKNEVIIGVGVDSDLNIQWADAFAWAFTSEDYGNKLRRETIKNYLAEKKKLNVPEFGTWLYSEVEANYVRRPFTPINENTPISYPDWLCVLCIVLSNLVTVLATIFPAIDQVMALCSDLRRKIF
jgi:hypothetical protein